MSRINTLLRPALCALALLAVGTGCSAGGHNGQTPSFPQAQLNPYLEGPAKITPALAVDASSGASGSSGSIGSSGGSNGAFASQTDRSSSIRPDMAAAPRLQEIRQCWRCR